MSYPPPQMVGTERREVAYPSLPPRGVVNVNDGGSMTGDGPPTQYSLQDDYERPLNLRVVRGHSSHETSCN